MFTSLSLALKDEEFCDKLDNLDLTWCYKNITLNNVLKFTNVLLENGIDPLDYMDKVPALYMRKSSIESISLREGLTEIGELAFSQCTNLREVLIPSTVTSIDDYAFLSCSNLEAVYIPKTVKHIGEAAFTGCYKAVVYTEAAYDGEDFDPSWTSSIIVRRNSTIDEFKRRVL